MQLYEQLKGYNKSLEFYDQQIAQAAKENELCKAIIEVEGVGPITASAFVATVDNGSVFKRGRELSAWLGLVPKQYSSGNSIRLLGIRKRGDTYLRKLLIHGARTVVKNLKKKEAKKANGQRIRNNT